jgi:hypothetical protein
VNRTKQDTISASLHSTRRRQHRLNNENLQHGIAVSLHQNLPSRSTGSVDGNIGVRSARRPTRRGSEEIQPKLFIEDVKINSQAKTNSHASSPEGSIIECKVNIDDLLDGASSVESSVDMKDLSKPKSFIEFHPDGTKEVQIPCSNKEGGGSGSGSGMKNFFGDNLRLTKGSTSSSSKNKEDAKPKDRKGGIYSFLKRQLSSEKLQCNKEQVWITKKSLSDHSKQSSPPTFDYDVPTNNYIQREDLTSDIESASDDDSSSVSSAFASDTSL